MSIEQAYDRLAQAAPAAPENGEPRSGASDGDGSDGGAGARDGAEAGGESGGGKPDGAAEDAGADATPDADTQGDSGPDSPNATSGGGSADADGAGASGDGSGIPGGSDTTAEGERPRSHDPCGTGEVMDAAARAGNEDGDAMQAAADTSAEEQAWDTALHQALNFARAQGAASGGVEQTVREAHRHDLDWRALLRRYMTEAAADDYSWSLPNRRHIDAGLYLPALYSEGVEIIAVIVDTSGSVDEDALARFWTEARAIASDVEAQNVVVVQVDSAVQDAWTYAFGELPDEIAVRGRGGADFRPGFAWLEEQGIRPACRLYFTDMICDRYPAPNRPSPSCGATGDRPSRPETDTTNPGESASICGLSDGPTDSRDERISILLESAQRPRIAWAPGWTSYIPARFNEAGAQRPRIAARLLFSVVFVCRGFNEAGAQRPRIERQQPHRQQQPAPASMRPGRKGPG